MSYQTADFQISHALRVRHADISCTASTMDLASRVEAIEKYLGMSEQSDQLYEQQIKVLTEDFKQERLDRVKQFERAEQLKMQLERLKRDYNALRRKCSALENTNRALNTKLYGEGAVPKLFQRYECDDNAEEERLISSVDM